MDAITLTSVSKHFGSVQAVRGIDLTIGQGEVVAVLGPNGAGKTTTIDMVLGLSTPTAGDVTVFGLPPRDAVERGMVSAVMQSGGLLKDMTVRECVEYTAALFASSRPVDEVLETAGLTALADRRIKDCSGGEQQRTRFAMALAPDPELIVLDEPTTGMDVTARRSFWSAIREDAERGRTVVFATHYLEEAETYADRVVVVREGRVVADGTPAELGAMTSRTGRARDAVRRRPRGPAGPAGGRRGRRARQRRDHHHLRQRRRRPSPPHRDRRPRPRGRGTQPRGHLRRAHRRRRPRLTTHRTTGGPP